MAEVKRRRYTEDMPIRLTPQTPMGSILAMPRPDFPRTLEEFQRRFVDEEACWLYQAESRWPDGFRCPWCGSEAALELPAAGPDALLMAIEGVRLAPGRRQTRNLATFPAAQYGAPVARRSLARPAHRFA